MKFSGAGISRKIELTANVAIIFAVVLIGLGLIFLLQSLGFVSHLMHYIWPVMLIGLGVWLIVRRVGYMQGGSK